MREAIKVPLEHMFNSHDNCSSEWCFKTRASEEGKTYNERDDEFRCKQNDKHLYNLLKKTLFPFQTDKFLKESLHMFDTQKNESMKNVIAYVALKNKTMAHSMSLNNRISCVVGISIFGFKTYWKQVFGLMQIQTSSTFEQFLQAETLNARKNKSYYQRYDVKGLRAFHKQAMIKQQIYDNMLARRSGMGYSQGIQFQKSLVNMEEAKGLAINNQQKQCKCGSIKHLRISSKDCPVGLAIRKAEKSALETAPSKLEAKKAAEDSAEEEERKCLAEEAAGKGGKPDEGASAGYVV